MNSSRSWITAEYSGFCNNERLIVGSTEVIFMIFVLFIVYSDWLRVNHLSFPKQRKGSGFLDIFSRQKLVVRKFVKLNANVLREKIKGNKIIHAVNSRKCRFVLAAQVFAVSVTQKGFDYFVITLIDQMQAYKKIVKPRYLDYQEPRQ